MYENVIRNESYAEKIPSGQNPEPQTFFLENVGRGKRFYYLKNKDSIALWERDTTRIFVGILKRFNLLETALSE